MAFTLQIGKRSKTQQSMPNVSFAAYSVGHVLHLPSPISITFAWEEGEVISSEYVHCQGAFLTKQLCSDTSA